MTAQRQRQALELLEQRVLDPSSLEQALHDALKKQWWLFGGAGTSANTTADR